MGEAEEFRFEIMEDLTKSYRLSVKAQVIIFIFIMLGIIVGVYNIAFLAIELKIGAIVILAALIYPFIIKSVSNLSESIAMALYFGAMFSLTYLVLKFYTGQNIRDAALIFLFLEIMGIEMLHHLLERFRVEKNSKSYLLVAILSVPFFVALFYVLQPIGMFYAIIASIAITIVFAYAIMPERPF